MSKLDEILHTILDADPGARKNGDHRFTIRCPAHPDSNPSLSVSREQDRILLHCHAGCLTENVLQALNLKWSDLFEHGGKATVERLAEIKKLPVEFLERLKLADCKVGVRVPYFDGEGRRLITKYRTSMFGKDKMRYRKGDKAQVYGLFMGKLWKENFLVLVEGESDCWTLWYHDIPAYGLPGNKALRPLEKEHLEGFDRLYISCEQDDGGGEAFVRNCCKRLKELRFKGEVLKITSGQYKDPSDLHAAAPERFKERWRRVIADAEPLDIKVIAGERPKNAVDRLVSHALSRAKVFLDEDTTLALACVKDEGSELHLPVCSADFQRWLMRSCGEVMRTSTVKEAIANIAVRYTKTVRTHCRVARVEGYFSGQDRIYYDLGDGKVVEITSNGWQVLDRSPVVFLRGKDYGVQPAPVKGGKLEDLTRLINFPGCDLPLLVAWLLDALKGRKPYTFLSINGGQGTGKSWSRYVLKSLLDPSRKANGLALPETGRDLAILAKNRFLLDFDNVSRIEPEMSDALCRLATGNGFVVRKLYSDDDEAIFGGANPVALNGIPDFVDRPDLQGRIIALALQRITDDRRKDEGSLERDFAKLRPGLLGCLFDLLANGLRHLAGVQANGGPRMMDTYRWLMACEQGTDLNLAETYRRHVEDTLATMATSDMLVQALLDLLEEGGWKFEGQAKELYRDVVAVWPGETLKEERQCPGNANVLGSRLRQLEEPLARIGVNIQFRRDKRNRVISVDATEYAKGPVEALLVNNDAVDEALFIARWPDHRSYTASLFCCQNADWLTAHGMSQDAVTRLARRLAQEGKLEEPSFGSWRRRGQRGDDGDNRVTTEKKLLSPTNS
jgi:hypothetical protein